MATEMEIQFENAADTRAVGQSKSLTVCTPGVGYLICK